MARTRFINQTYICKAGHESQYWVETTKLAEKRPCRRAGCKLKSEHARIVKYREARRPTEIGVNAAGEVWYPGQAGESLPDGYERREILPSEIRAWERRMNREMRERESIERAADNQLFSDAKKQLREEVLQESREWDDLHRNLLREAIAQQDSGYSRQYDPSFRIAAYN